MSLFKRIRDQIEQAVDQAQGAVQDLTHTAAGQVPAASAQGGAQSFQPPSASGYGAPAPPDSDVDYAARGVQPVQLQLARALNGSSSNADVAVRRGTWPWVGGGDAEYVDLLVTVPAGVAGPGPLTLELRLAPWQQHGGTYLAGRFFNRFSAWSGSERTPAAATRRWSSRQTGRVTIPAGLGTVQLERVVLYDSSDPSFEQRLVVSGALPLPPV